MEYVIMYFKDYGWYEFKRVDKLDDVFKIVVECAGTMGTDRIEVFQTVTLTSFGLLKFGKE